MFVSNLFKGTLVLLITLSCTSNCLADNFKTISKTISAFSSGALKQGTSMVSGIKSKRNLKSSTYPSVVVKTINKTVLCPSGGTLTARGKATIDSINKSVAMNSYLSLEACNSITGKGSSYLSASQSGTLITYSLSLPASNYTGKCQDGSAGTFKISKLAILGQYDQSTRINNATISGSISAICGSTTKISCNWTTPIPLNDKTTLMSYCTGVQ